MGYQALLFCPDEKTARTVTQVLNELEFNVEPCIEPFAAVKKLMGEHFDAVVVDCDNEQNATLLFKSARNSTSNQTSLAVAVVEGQAGVAKAFRIGANLVLTKPINIEQAKGTLRVARGLLRKGEPAKPGAPAAAPTPQAAASAPAPAKPTPKPVSAAKPVAPAPQATPAPREIPAAKPAAGTPAWPAAAAASAPQAPRPSNLPPVPKAAPAPAAPYVPEPSAPKVEVPSFAKTPEAPAAIQASPTSNNSSAGAATAAAPAREPDVPKAPEVAAVSTVESPKTVASFTTEPTSVVGAAPTFTFGGSAEPATGGGNKKIFIGVAAAVVITAAAYFGWAAMSHHTGTATAPAATTQSAPATPQGKLPGEPSSAPAATGPVETATATAPSTTVPEESAPSPKETVSKPTATRNSTSSSPAKSVAKEKAAQEEAPQEADATPEAAPLMVKGGKAPEKAKSTATEVSAPSMIGMATPASAPPPDLVPTTTSEFKPKLQTMSVSQGVSQGLLYKKVAPVYPPTALRLRVEGTVELLATISKSGDISQVKVVSGDSQLSKAAADAVKQWKYKPYLLNGEPVEIQTQVTIKFKLPN